MHRNPPAGKVIFSEPCIVPAGALLSQTQTVNQNMAKAFQNPEPKPVKNHADIRSNTFAVTPLKVGGPRSVLNKSDFLRPILHRIKAAGGAPALRTQLNPLHLALQGFAAC